MIIAIFSDIHSNLEALKACYKKACALGVKQFVCLGDIVGYAADPVPTLEMVMSLPNLIAVRGNHDETALSGEYPGTGKSIQESVRWTHKQLSKNHKDFINNLSYVEQIDTAVFAHASVFEPDKWDYLYDAPQIKLCMDASNRSHIFLGHTHLPVIYYETASGEIKEIIPDEANAVPLYQNRRYVINAGSVGQPRDGNSAASFVVYNSDESEVTFYRVFYDFTETAKKILASDLPPAFARRLDRSGTPK